MGGHAVKTTFLILLVSAIVVLAVIRSMSRPARKIRRRRLKPRWSDDGRPDFRR